MLNRTRSRVVDLRQAERSSMGYPAQLAIRYLRSKKRDFISVGTAFAILGVALGVAALVTVMSVTGGFQAQFRDKVLGVNAHVLVLKEPFRDYREVMEKVAAVPGVTSVAPFTITPMMVTYGGSSATGVLVKGVDPALSLGVEAPDGTVPVLDLPQYVIEGDLGGLRLADSKPAELPPAPLAPLPFPEPSSLSGEPRVPGPSPAEPLGPAPEPPPPPELDPSEAPEDAPAVAPLLPEGSVVPEGGYASVLPDDDALPDDIDTDLCSDPEEVGRLPGIVVGSTLAKSLELGLGECVTVTSPTIGMSFSGGEIRPPVAKRFRVTAIFEAGFEQYDAKLVYADLYETQQFYQRGDTVTGVEMRVADIDEARAVASQIDEALGSGPFLTMDWMELNHGLFTALKIQQIGMSSVLALIIVVAAFTVIATLIMVVLDKKKEIAVLKAMGATDDGILRAFLYQGGIIGGLGTSLGLLLGYGVCKGLLIYAFPLDPGVYFISRLPVQARPQEFLITGAVALLICLAATIVPSLYAARLRPAEGFRNG